MLRNLGVMYKCENCGYECNESIKELNMGNVTKELALNKVNCKCGNVFTIEDGFKRYLKSNLLFSFYQIISDVVIERYDIEVCIGRPKKIKFPTPIRHIEGIFLSPLDGFLAGVNFQRNFDIEQWSEITIVTSENYKENGEIRGPRVGEMGKLNVNVYGVKNNSINYPIWFKFIVESKKEMLNGNYTLSILSSCISCENFIDSLLITILSSKGISNEVSHFMLSSMVDIKKKVQKILSNLDNINTNKVTEIKRWIELIEARNKIAHGEKNNCSKEEAAYYFNIAIDFIFYLNRESSVDMIYKNFVL